jgi:hypothetical protein
VGIRAGQNLALPPKAEVRAAAADSIVLAVACMISYWLTTSVRYLVYSVSRGDDVFAVGLLAAWLGLRAIRPLIRSPGSP